MMQTIFINDIEFELVPVYKGDEGKLQVTQGVFSQFQGYLIKPLPEKEPINKPKGE